MPNDQPGWAGVTLEPWLVSHLAASDLIRGVSLGSLA